MQARESTDASACPQNPLLRERVRAIRAFAIDSASPARHILATASR